MGGDPPQTLSPVVFKTPTKNPQIFYISCWKYSWVITTDLGFVPCPRGNDTIPFLWSWCHHWGSGKKSGAFSGLEANQRKRICFYQQKQCKACSYKLHLTEENLPGFSWAVFFCERALQPACVGADAKHSSNSSHVLDVFARAHAGIKDRGKPWQPWPEGSTKHSRPPSESIYADCTDALLQHQCGQQQCTQWKRKLSQKKNKTKRS